MSKKKCGMCGLYLDESFFRVTTRTRADGTKYEALSSYCKGCYREYDREHKRVARKVKKPRPEVNDCTYCTYNKRKGCTAKICVFIEEGLTV